MIKVKINSTGQTATCQADGELRRGQEVLIDSDSIIELAVVICVNCSKEVQKDEKKDLPEVHFVRELTDSDQLFKRALKEKAEKYLSEVKNKVQIHNLPMKILDADLSFDEKKLTIYFASETRVDFRSLVSDLVGTFRKIIRLQQVGSRDEAKLFGGFGKCGRELCCQKFLKNLDGITLEMAQIQEMAVGNPSKITGCCGKLMCCLSYEADIYQKIKSKMPKVGSEYKTSQGEGKVLGHNILEGRVVLETKEGKKIEVII